MLSICRGMPIMNSSQALSVTKIMLTKSVRHIVHMSKDTAQNTNSRIFHTTLKTVSTIIVAGSA